MSKSIGNIRYFHTCFRDNYFALIVLSRENQQSTKDTRDINFCSVDESFPAYRLVSEIEELENEYRSEEYWMFAKRLGSKLTSYEAEQEALKLAMDFHIDDLLQQRNKNRVNEL